MLDAQKVVVQAKSNINTINDLVFLKLYHSLCRLAIISICLIVCAGGFVRMTGSGMGCPDWPKCFGKWIPPTHISDLPENYKEIYSHRGYDKIDFNAFNTWAEYINRLLGAIGGLLCFLLFIVSILTRKISLVFLSFFLVCLMAFQAWMGALVVYSILLPWKITVHMLIALFILCILFFLFHYSSSIKEKVIIIGNKWIVLCLFISLIQIILGTQVRESVDALLYIYDRDVIINKLPNVFEVHRTMAWLIILSNCTLFWFYRNLFAVYIEFRLIIITLLGLLISGVIMSYDSLIGFAQLCHLLCAISLFMCQYSLLLKSCSLPNVQIP